jgi:hypothetical protein
MYYIIRYHTKKFGFPSAPSITRDTANFLLSGVPGTTWYKDGSAITDTAQKYKPTAAGSYTAKTTTNCKIPLI